MKIEHLAFNVRDPRAMGAWYCEHLGMNLVREGGAPKFGRFIADDSGVMLEIYNDAAEPYFAAADTSVHAFHLAFSTADFAASHAKLLAAGGTAIGAVNNTPKGDQLAFIRDPWGLTIQLVQRAGT